MKFCVVRFEAEKSFDPRSAEKLKKYFEEKFKGEEIFEHSEKNEKGDYRYPEIQYFVDRGQLCVLGASASIDILKDKMRALNEIVIGDEVIADFNLMIEEFEEEFKVLTSFKVYKFETPWLPMTKEEYEQYKKGEIQLNKYLEDDINSNFKDLGIWVEDPVKVLGDFSSKTLYIKDIERIGFYGEFACNVTIPKYMGFGNSRLIGYGRVHQFYSKHD